MSSLQARLQNPDYINWVKAGLCLIHTKSGLHDFADTASQSLHQSILTNIIPTSANTAQPVCGISIRRQNLITTCAHPYCQGFLAAVINNGIDPTHTFTVRPGNLSNCDVITVGQWHTHHWQVAKLFMNQGQLPTQVNPSATDMSGIINFLSHCKVPRYMMTNVLLLDKVRKARNGIMHTANMKLSNADLHTYSQAMTDLLNDPGIACFPTAQLALADIQSIINAAEFQITLEDEGKVIDELAAEIRRMTEGMKYKLEAVAECGEADRQAIKEQLNKEIKKVSSLYEVLKGEVETGTGTQKQIEDKITSLQDQLGRVTEDLRSFDIKLGDIGRQQHKLAKQQEEFCIETKQAFAEVKEKQGQTNDRLEELTNTNAHKYSNPLDEDAKERLRQYLQSTYKDNLQVTPLSDWTSLNVPDIFTPVVLVGGNRQTLVSYKDLFYKEGILQKKIILLGKAGTGKTTFSKHLADIWCNPTSKRQFDDVDVLQQFQFLFYVSFRFAEKHEIVLEMIQNQLFDDEEMQAIACHVLKHNSDSCLILMDGFDEYQRQTLAKTGKRGDITGFPSLTGVQDCILLVTSRPWKFYSLPEEDQKIFSTMELDGIKDNEELIEVILTKLEDPDPAKSCSDFRAQMKNNKMTEIMKSPLMLIFAIDIWESERSLPKSICMNYIKMIESFVCRYQTKREEVITKNTEVCVKKLEMDKYSESAKLLPNILSNYEFVQMHAGLYLSLGHLASDFLIGQEKQSMVFQKEACKRYNIKENDGSLKLCLDLGILTKLESTMRGIKRTESFQFCHKTFQEFFAAVWLARKYTKEGSQEKLILHFCIETEDDLLNHGVLIQFMCALNPELGSDFWKYIAQENIIKNPYWTTVDWVQNLILKAVKEAHYCCDTQREQLYYCISHVRINDNTSDEDVSLLCKMIQNNSTYLGSLEMIFKEQICLSYSQYHSLLSSISCATNLTTLALPSISCQTNVSSECLPVLNLHKHHKLLQLKLANISTSGLILPSQEDSQLGVLYLINLMLSHENLVQLCSSLSSLTDLYVLGLTNISCSDNSLNLGLPVLDLHRHFRINELSLNEISISGLLLPSQEESRLYGLYLDNLVLSHDNLVQLCSSLSSLTGLLRLKLTNISCSDNSLNLGLPVLDLHRHCGIAELSLNKIYISGLLLPSQEESYLRDLYLDNLVLSHDNLVQLCSSLSSLTDLRELKLINISFSDNSLDLGLLGLDLHRHCSIEVLLLKEISISGLVLPSQEESKLCKLYMDNLVLSHDNLVQLCSSLSNLTDLHELKLTNVSCSDDLHRHCIIEELSLNKISISGLQLPSQEQSQLRYLYLDNLVLSHGNLVQLCSWLSSLTDLCVLTLTNISCRDDSGSCELPVLDLHRHDRLSELALKKISIRGLLLPNQEESKLCELYLDNLVLSHDNLVQLCSSLSSLTGLCELILTNISCSDDSSRCDLPVLDLHRHDRLDELSLDKISISGLLLPSQEESELCELYLYNLVLSHDKLVQLCSSLSSLTNLWELKLINISCSDNSLNLGLPVLDLHRHCSIDLLSLNKISISGLLLPNQEQSELHGLYMDNLVLSHDNLVQLYASLSFVITDLEMLDLTNLTCSDHGGSCHLLLDLHRHVNLSRLRLDKISLSVLLLPSQEEPKLWYLELNNMLLSHDSLVQLCSSISSLTAFKWLELTNLRCYDHGGSGDIPILDFPKPELEYMDLEQIQVKNLQALSGLEDLQDTIMPYSEQSGECIFTVLDLHKHYKLKKLKLDSSSISGILLRRQERLRFKRLVIKNLVLSHYSLEQLCASLSSLSALNVKLHFTKLSCRDHDGGYCFPELNQPDTELNVTDTDSEMDSSDDDSDSDESDSDYDKKWDVS